MAEVRLQRIRKIFGATVAAADVDLVVADGEFVVLVGPSGCGKTTLLRCLAGLEQVDGGEIYIGGRDATALPPRARRIAMVFQSYALFPHMTVRDNVAFGLRMRREPRPTIDARVASVVQLLGIPHLLDRYPSQLSGGQRQRVAVARALATEADVLLMDEPLSNLDALLRMQMRAELKALLQRLGTTTVYVTHDQVEALSMGDRVAVMRAGRIVQIDSPLAVYDNPADTYVGGFIGTPPMNFLPAAAEAAGGEWLVRLSGGAVRLPAAQVPGGTARPLLLGIRAESVEVELSPADGLLPARVVVTEPLGSHNLLTVRSGTDMLKVSARADLFLPPDRDVWLRLDPRKIRWMDRETGAALRPALPDGDRSSAGT